MRQSLWFASLLAVGTLTATAFAQPAQPVAAVDEEDDPSAAVDDAAEDDDGEAPDVSPSEVGEVVQPEAVAEAAVEAEEPPPLPELPPSPGGSGSSSASGGGSPAASTDVGIPLNLNLHGYYRARYQWMGNTPQGQRRVGDRRFQRSVNTHFAFQRLRLVPEVTYGRDPDNPVAALYMQFDGLDNAVFGDNARIAPAPLFANDPSVTDIEGFDIADSIRLERAWLQFLIPVGQIRIGRMPSSWGMGLLSNDGNGLGEWGDPLFGTTYDRVLFATRPISIFNAISKGDARPTPLIYAIAYDKLVEDPLTVSTDSPWVEGQAPTWGSFGPYGTQPQQRSNIPFGYVGSNNNDVHEIANALIWVDPDFGPKPTDELRVGMYYVWRWQNRGARIGDARPDDDSRTLPLEPTSRVHILDWYYKVDIGLGPGLPSFYSEAEVTWITGRSNTIPITGGCGAEAPGVCLESDANVWGGAFRAGVRQNDKWGALIEAGFSSGDATVFGADGFTARPLHPDHHVGLLMYQVALQVTSAVGLTDQARPLWTRGGVWNSWYGMPQVRFHIIPGFELHAAFLTGFARKLVPGIHQNPRASGNASCGAFDGDCWLGWEADVALRVKWGANDLLRWDTEIGMMQVGNALRDTSSARPAGGGIGDDFLWTIQTRMGMVF
ncbi:MAG: hypothetical protein JJ863_13295 [Deltaproteobacteria bacterium]|nr:hypothetical protein [Deltaproteobacteria bacterium]